MYANLKLQLWKTGTRQNRLAKLLELDESVLSKIINGFREPSRDLRVRVAELLQCDPDWLFETERAAVTAESEPTRRVAGDLGGVTSFEGSQ